MSGCRIYDEALASARKALRAWDAVGVLDEPTVAEALSGLIVVKLPGFEQHHEVWLMGCPNEPEPLKVTRMQKRRALKLADRLWDVYCGYEPPKPKVIQLDIVRETAAWGARALPVAPCLALMRNAASAANEALTAQEARYSERQRAAWIAFDALSIPPHMRAAPGDNDGLLAHSDYPSEAWH